MIQMIDKPIMGWGVKKYINILWFKMVLIQTVMEPLDSGQPF
jgi:hypothetical protein